MSDRMIHDTGKRNIRSNWRSLYFENLKDSTRHYDILASFSIVKYEDTPVNSSKI